ncbi:hypothetical protein VNO78_02427 [Psophocarpus tetragonolobus]|uniref:Uncharacterized protein n=1 Tax=Psophocarpus tetragonolobus TaxID=3891 RepID=A0AAN9XV31_PSOTE
MLFPSSQIAEFPDKKKKDSKIQHCDHLCIISLSQLVCTLCINPENKIVLCCYHCSYWSTVIANYRSEQENILPPSAIYIFIQQ